MATTIQIRESTKQMLVRVKELEAKPTFDDVITGLVKERLSIPRSFFGKGKGRIPRFKGRDRLKLHGL